MSDDADRYMEKRFGVRRDVDHAEEWLELWAMQETNEAIGAQLDNIDQQIFSFKMRLKRGNN